MLFHFSCSSTMHIACSTHIHTGETVLVVYLSIHLFIPQSVCLSICSSISLSAYPSVHPSVCLPIHLFIPQSICLSICSSISLSVYPSVHPSVCLSICSSISLPVYSSVCLSICLSVIQIKPSFWRQKHQPLSGFPNITSQIASCYSHNFFLVVWFHFNNKVHAGVQYSTCTAGTLINVAALIMHCSKLFLRCNVTK